MNSIKNCNKIILSKTWRESKTSQQTQYIIRRGPSQDSYLAQNLWYIEKIILTFKELILYLKMRSLSYVAGGIHLAPVLKVGVKYCSINV